jgi:hypothetical protein
MPQVIAKSSNVPPCHSGADLLRSVAEPDSRFADPSQTALHGIDRLIVWREGGLVHVRGVPLDACNILQYVFE